MLRMEDIDTPRVVPGAADDILRELEAFGFEWDGDVLYQSRRFARYDEVLGLLRDHVIPVPAGRDCHRAVIRDRSV